MRVLDRATVEKVVDGGTRGRFLQELVELPPRGLRAIRLRDPAGARRPPVLLVHGFAQNRLTWDTSRRSFAAWLAARGWDAWNLELRGHGHSRGVPPDRGGFADYVEDVVDAVDALDRPPFLVGHSLGGAACYAAATRRAVPGVVGIGAVFGFGRGNLSLALLARLTSWLGPVVPPGLRLRTAVVGRVLARATAMQDLAGWLGQGPGRGRPALLPSGWWPGSIEPEVLDERLVEGFDWTDARTWLDMARWAVEGRFDHAEAWSRTEVPVLVVVGDEDHLLPPVDAWPAWATAGGPDRTFKVFDHVDHEDHWGHLDLVLGHRAPRHTWPWIERWMAERAGGEAA